MRLSSIIYLSYLVKYLQPTVWKLLKISLTNDSKDPPKLNGVITVDFYTL